jgi:integrase
MAGSMRQRGPSSWELRVHVGRDPDTGAKQYATKTVRGTKREAEKELARLVAQVDDGQVATMADLCEAWYAQHQPDWSPTTAQGYRAILDRHVLPRLGRGDPPPHPDVRPRPLVLAAAQDRRRRRRPRRR